MARQGGDDNDDDLSRGPSPSLSRTPETTNEGKAAPHIPSPSLPALPAPAHSQRVAQPCIRYAEGTMPSCSALAPRAARHTPHLPSHLLITPRIKTPTSVCYSPGARASDPLMAATRTGLLAPPPPRECCTFWVTRVEELPRLWLNSTVRARARGFDAVSEVWTEPSAR